MKQNNYIYHGGVGEICIKKSRFIAHIEPISNEEEALGILNSLRKEYWDARHNCFAYTLGKNYELQRCSDDGEPSGTAGRPMLDLLLHEQIHNCIAVVTRYFGGTLLGTGGLVRAYQDAVHKGLSACTIINKTYGQLYTITTDYSTAGKLQYIFEKEHIPVVESRFTEHAEFDIVLSLESAESVKSALTEAANGKLTITPGNETSFAQVDRKTLLFPDI